MQHAEHRGNEEADPARRLHELGLGGEAPDGPMHGKGAASATSETRPTAGDGGAMAGRGTREVLEDHLQQAVAGDIETDLERNYAEDVVVLTGFGVFRGHEGLREVNRILQRQLPGARYDYRTRLDHEEIALLEWGAESESARVDDGADTYHVRDGRIRVQTIHYTLTSKRPEAKESSMASDRQLMDRCIEECFAVVRTASECAHSCLDGGQADAMAQCIHLCLDSAAISTACAEMMIRHSQVSGQACGVCADVCDACAAECERYEGDVMRRCAEACRRCAQTCRQMAA